VRLIHLTDPHLSTPPDWRSLAGRSHFGKRYLGYASWFRKRRHQLRRAWLDEMTVEMAALNPDLVILTGDLTQIGTEEEIRQARDWLEGLAPAGRVAFVPGNHDTYAKDSWPVLQRELKDYLPADGAGYPLVRRRTWQSSGCAALSQPRRCLLPGDSGRISSSGWKRPSPTIPKH
jgi:hypothetical protein